MPHSSGGGSHGGGSHSGGSSHSSSSSYSSSSSSYGSSYDLETKISTDYFRGADKYVYYNYSGKIKYIYADRTPCEPELSVVATIVIIFTLIAAGLIWFLWVISIFLPKAIDTKSYDSGPMIIDDVGVVNNQKDLYSSLQRFIDVSGVSPAVEIVEDRAWISNYTDLETYAYSEYLRLFDDEKHWLIVISYPEDYKTAEFVDWKWEGMIGDDCSDAFNDRSEELFTTTIQRYMLRTDLNSVGQNLANAYNSFCDVCMENQIDEIGIVFMVIVLIAYIALSFFYIWDYIKRKQYSGAVRVTKKNKEHNCEYCGSLYLLGTVTSCPGCGAPVQASNE